MDRHGALMTVTANSRFRLEGNGLHASALRAQVIERCRRALNHDMNNAVQSIHSGLELLSKCLSTPGIARVSPQDCINLLQQQFVTLQQTLGKLLDEIAVPPGDPEAFDISALVTDALHTLRHERAVMKAQVHIDAGVTVDARKVNVRSVILALVLDAIDEMQSEGGLEISVDARGKQGIVEIRTSGSRMTNDANAALPAPERPIERVTGDLIAAENGDVQFEHAAAHRRVQISLPASLAQLDTQPAESTRPDGGSLSTAGVLRVLIADRNRDAADSLAMILQLEGHEARTLYSGTHLSETLASFAPHLVLLDSDLPDCDVRALARDARSARAGKLPMLAQVSSNDVPHDEEFDARLVRPVEWPELQALLGAAKQRY